MRIVYFAWVREAIGLDDEVRDVPDGVETPRALAAWLATHSAGHAAAFADMDRLRVACDQQMTALDDPIGTTREIAFFPPVTGG